MRGVRSLVVAEYGLVAGLRTQDAGSGRVGLAFPATLRHLHGNAGGAVSALKIREERLEGPQVFRSASKLSEQVGRSLPAEGRIRVNGGVVLGHRLCCSQLEVDGAFVAGPAAMSAGNQCAK